MRRCVCRFIFFFQAEDGIRDLVRSRGLGDVYKRQARVRTSSREGGLPKSLDRAALIHEATALVARSAGCLLYTSDAADERSSVDLGGRRIIKKKKRIRKRIPPCDSITTVRVSTTWRQ